VELILKHQREVVEDRYNMFLNAVDRNDKIEVAKYRRCFIKENRKLDILEEMDRDKYEI
jgi:hypothetical protein